MSVIRAARSSEGRYVQIMNAALQDERLSFRARGLMAYLLSLPPSARVDSAKLAERTKEGREAIRTALRELEEYGYLRRTAKRTTKGTFRANAVVCDDPSLPLDDEPAPENPAPENPTTDKPPKKRPPAPRNPPSDARAPKDKDGGKESPSDSAAPGGSEPTVSQRANTIARGFCDRYPLHSFHGIRSIVTRAIQAGYADRRIADVLAGLAIAGKPVTVGTIRWELEGPPRFEREQRPRTVSDPGTRVHDNGLEVLGGPVNAVPPNQAFMEARKKTREGRHE